MFLADNVRTPKNTNNSASSEFRMHTKAFQPQKKCSNTECCVKMTMRKLVWVGKLPKSVRFSWPAVTVSHFKLNKLTCFHTAKQDFLDKRALFFLFPFSLLLLISVHTFHRWQPFAYKITYLVLMFFYANANENLHDFLLYLSLLDGKIFLLSSSLCGFRIPVTSKENGYIHDVKRFWHLCVHRHRHLNRPKEQQKRSMLPIVWPRDDWRWQCRKQKPATQCAQCTHNHSARLT